LFYVTRRRFGFWNKGRLAIALALVLTLLVSGCARVTDGAVLVTRVIDGDTIEIEGGYRVRYIGINAPERGEFYYWEALQANRDLVEGKKVWLEGDIEDRDRYDRLLRYVWVDNTMANAELVRLGYAYSYAYPPNLKYQTYLLQMEKEAREHGWGLWGN